MQFLRTLGWLACVVYSTIPMFWLMVHPRAHLWREGERSPFRVLVPAWIVTWIGVGALTGPWRAAAFYSTLWMWLPAALLFAVGIFMYSQAGAHFSWAQLGGLPEVRSGNQDQRLVTAGIRSRVRHPVYLAVITGAVMIRMEDEELEKRFGEEYRAYRLRVPAVLPRLGRRVTSVSKTA
jgi:protein-S-isoprenylcysteine O-methyltransferase Ste14